MMDNNYLVAIKGKYRVTAKFNKEITGQEVGIVKVGNMLLVQENPPPEVSMNAQGIQVSTGTPHTPRETQRIDWPAAFIQFITEAEVPQRGNSRDGSYDLNKYSEPAMKAFKKILESGVDYLILVNSTKIYYKTHKQYQNKISKYIEDGIWRSDYEALKASAEKGGEQGIIDHVKNEVDNGTEFSRFKQG